MWVSYIVQTMEWRGWGVERLAQGVRLLDLRLTNRQERLDKEIDDTVIWWSFGDQLMVWVILTAFLSIKMMGIRIGEDNGISVLKQSQYCQKDVIDKKKDGIVWWRQRDTSIQTPWQGFEDYRTVILNTLYLGLEASWSLFWPGLRLTFWSRRYRNTDW